MPPAKARIKKQNVEGAGKLRFQQSLINLIIICICASSAQEIALSPSSTKRYLCDGHAIAEGKSRGFEIGELTVLAVRREGQVFVYKNRCPHRGVALEWQPDQFLDSSASLIQCATHGALFLIEDGQCVAGPCEGESLTAIPCGEDAQGVWITPPATD